MNKGIIAAIAGGIAVAIAAGIIAVSSAPAAVPEDGRAKVVASFFPLYDFTLNVAGDRADVTVFIPSGIEPHDWEPTPQNVAQAESADLLIYNGAGFESWIADINPRNAVDATAGLELLEAMEEHEEEEEHEGEEFDPHVWLDPVLAKHQVSAIRDGLVRVDQDNADYYRDNAAKYLAELDELDAFIRAELSSCEKTDFIAFHSAFSYFSKRYGLTQHAIQGLAPEGEVLPQRIQQVKNLANELGIDVIYSEELVDPRLAQVIAGEIPNGRVLVLSPLEGLDAEEERNGVGYIDKMRENVENLKVGLKCTQ
jgi:zinc transport system substrate-binding protein